MHTGTPLSGLYAIGCAANVVAALRALRRKMFVRTGVWALLAVGFGALGGLSLAGRPPVMPEELKAAIDSVLNPVTVSLGFFILLTVLFLGREFFVRPAVAWMIFNASLLFMALSLTDPEFAAVVGKPDNVPIVGLVFLLGFFTWVGAYQAVKNDRRAAADSPPVEKELDEKVLVWPDLVYTELICTILVTVVLIVWSLSLRAPLEQPANPVLTPNPAKAPWYFLGLQELLVFSDAWYVGVVVPCLIILGLMAIPYLDVNRRGGGYYTIGQRRFAYVVFQFGFLQLWILLILIGTFMRGPNWSFFGLYEVRDPYKVVELTNVKLSEYFWSSFGRDVPQLSPQAGAPAKFARVVWREIAGVVLMLLYFLGLPPLLGRTLLRRFRQQMGLLRYSLMAVLLLLMLTLPLKMMLRWSVNLSYFVSMPEYLFNF